jgi:hypothetical protein
MDAAVRSDVADPRSLAVRQLPKPTPEDVVLGQPGEFRVGRGQELKQRVVNHWLLSLLRPFLGLPAAGLYPLSGASRFRGSGHDLDLYLFGREEAPIVAESKARKNGADPLDSRSKIRRRPSPGALAGTMKGRAS